MVVVTGMKCHRRDCVNACVGHVIATIWPDADGSNTTSRNALKTRTLRIALSTFTTGGYITRNFLTS